MQNVWPYHEKFQLKMNRNNNNYKQKEVLLHNPELLIKVQLLVSGRNISFLLELFVFFWFLVCWGKKILYSNQANLTVTLHSEPMTAVIILFRLIVVYANNIDDSSKRNKHAYIINCAARILNVSNEHRNSHFFGMSSTTLLCMLCRFAVSVSCATHHVCLFLLIII